MKRDSTTHANADTAPIAAPKKRGRPRKTPIAPASNLPSDRNRNTTIPSGIGHRPTGFRLPRCQEQIEELQARLSLIIALEESQANTASTKERPGNAESSAGDHSLATTPRKNDIGVLQLPTPPASSPLPASPLETVSDNTACKLPAHRTAPSSQLQRPSLEPRN